MTDFARQWHENTEKLHQLERQESAQKAECESLASFLPSLEKQAEESGQLHEKNRAAFSSLQAERKKLLNGRSADSVEQEYIRRMEELKERLKKLSATQTEYGGGGRKRGRQAGRQAGRQTGRKNRERPNNEIFEYLLRGHPPGDGSAYQRHRRIIKITRYYLFFVSPDFRFMKSRRDVLFFSGVETDL